MTELSVSKMKKNSLERLYLLNKSIIFIEIYISKILLIIWNLIFLEYVWNSAYNYKYKIVIYIL